MKCASALSTARDFETASRSVLDRVAEGLGGETADLALAFTSMDHSDNLGGLSAAVRERGLGRHVLACTGESIVGDGQEVEGASAVSLWAIRLPGVALRPVRLTFQRGEFAGWPTDLAIAPEDRRVLILLGEPHSFPADRLLKRLNEEVPGLRVIGGMASGGGGPGENRVLIDDESYSDGAVALLIDGPVDVRSVVSQGCRPIGRPMIVTRAEGNLIRELGRRPSLEVLTEIFDDLTPEDQNLARHGLHVGRVIDEYRESFGRGDFLIRNVLGADQAGAIAISDMLRVGQTVQFHVRDATSADEDLRTLLVDGRLDQPQSRPAGALLFTCNGRGTRLFPTPNHDVGVIREVLGPIPVAGFFAQGEFGPVSTQNFIHGFTASIAIFGGDDPA